MKIQFAFDVGHSSLGWAALRPPRGKEEIPEITACGTVIFPKDDCLPKSRRAFRRMRRQIRATRQRIRRLRDLLERLGVLTGYELDERQPSPVPWLLAARVLAGGPLLSWPELWDALRWYAHNRGYEGSPGRSGDEVEPGSKEEKEDVERVETARNLMREHRRQTMAETVCAVLKVDPLRPRQGTTIRFKGLNAAFPRDTVVAEVERVLKAHAGRLPKVDDALIQALLYDHRALPGPDFHLPKRYKGGLLFGRLRPRFENRIIAVCPIHSEKRYLELTAEGAPPEEAKRRATRESKVPSKECVEFYRYRWAMLLANVRVLPPDGRSRFLTLAEKQAVNAAMVERGFLTAGQFQEAVKKATGGLPDNTRDMMTHPDAQQALVLDPVGKLTAAEPLATVWKRLPESLRRRAAGRWRKGKALTLSDILTWCDAVLAEEIRQALTNWLDVKNTRRRKNQSATPLEQILEQPHEIKLLTGRAPFHRSVLTAAWEHVLKKDTDIHPAEEGGPLFRDPLKKPALERRLEEKTNNHLVRHRLLMLRRLHREMIEQFAGGDASAVERVTIEVNRDLREMAGMTTKEKGQELGRKLAHFKAVAEKLKQACEGEIRNGRPVRVTAGLIRKARVADDLGWQCPYTGKTFDALDLLNENTWDKDHIIPQAERPSNALDSLVITLRKINEWKGRRTARQFIKEHGGEPVPGVKNLTLRTLEQYDAWVNALDVRRGHPDDVARKKFRQRLLRMDAWTEKEFVPRDLTVTSQLTRLGAEALREAYADLPAERRPEIVSLPGSVTGAVRRSWRLAGALARANPAILSDETDAQGQPIPLPKTEIRDITHLHHALDACVLALTGYYLPKDGSLWSLLVRRRLKPEEQTVMKRRLGPLFQPRVEGKWELADLPTVLKENIAARLAERRVAQHVPSEIGGLSVEQNVWRVVKVENGVATLKQSIRQPDGTRVHKTAKENVNKLLGVYPDAGEGKLKKLKGALVIPKNYGIALDPSLTVIPRHKVWTRLHALREDNGGKWPRVLRLGQTIVVPSGDYAGVWRVFSVKNSARGILVDMGRPDVVRLRNKTEGHKNNVRLASLLSAGMKIVPKRLTGFPAV